MSASIVNVQQSSMSSCIGADLSRLQQAAAIERLDLPALAMQMFQLNTSASKETVAVFLSFHTLIYFI
jgi:hypothetical protein